ncbi:MAG: hypothetical protein CVV07_01230 [Gammaproteobacteria bacterium HGW-Gammaproteobacteria-11]|nr:MAG: hypothetical protein CVV07_01230 [Gammaproteobacteria bacterium HGW-Gammaproteobacteria-11]
MEQINPFYCPKRHTYGACDVQGRLFMVTIFDSHQCAAALEVPGVQKTIIAAIKRRQRALAKENRELR